jgi:hypothetical protein
MHLPARQCFDREALHWLSISSGVRITQQGFTFYDTPVHHGGTSFECPRTRGALCSHGRSYTFLRCTDIPETMANEAPAPFHQLWQMEGCTGRVPTPNRFDVMPCDLRDGTALIWSDNRISVHYRMDVPYWPMLLISLIVVWLVINMGESVASILRVKGADSSGKGTSALCLVLVITVCMHTPTDLWVTDREYWTYNLVVFYILAYSAYHIVNPHTVNVIVGCLVLVTARFYQHNDTPYAAGFMFCVAARFVQKAYSTHFSGLDNVYQCTRVGFMVLDAIFFMLIYTESLQNAFADSMHGPLCLVGVLFAAFVVGKLLAEIVALHTA